MRVSVSFVHCIRGLYLRVESRVLGRGDGGMNNVCSAFSIALRRRLFLQVIDLLYKTIPVNAENDDHTSWLYRPEIKVLNIVYLFYVLITSFVY